MEKNYHDVLPRYAIFISSPYYIWKLIENLKNLIFYMNFFSWYMLFELFKHCVLFFFSQAYFYKVKALILCKPGSVYDFFQDRWFCEVKILFRMSGLWCK